MKRTAVAQSNGMDRRDNRRDNRQGSREDKRDQKQEGRSGDEKKETETAPSK